MREVAVFEAKTKLSELLDDVERGEQVAITRRGVPVARLVPAAAARKSVAVSQKQKVHAVFAELKKARKGVTLDLPVRRAIEDGRD
jgi:prevent-host-death family protein